MSGVHLRVRAGGEDYALPVASVLEIAELGAVAPVPGAPEQVLGMRNLRGQVIPVLGLAAVLGLAEAAEPTRIVVAVDRERRAALAVEDVVDVAELADATEDAESPYLSGALLVDGALVGIVDVVTVLDDVAQAA